MSVVTLKYRQFNKQDSYFLVQYEEDDMLQVRGRGFLRTDEKITIGKSYRVQYGLSLRESSSAKVIASGSEQEMRAEKSKRDKSSKKQQPKQRPKPTNQPTTKRRKSQQDESSKENARPTKVQKQKPRASIVKVCPPPPPPSAMVEQVQEISANLSDDIVIPAALPPLSTHQPTVMTTTSSTTAVTTTRTTTSEESANLSDDIVIPAALPPLSTHQPTVMTTTTSTTAVTTTRTTTTETTTARDDACAPLTTDDLTESILRNLQAENRPPLMEARQEDNLISRPPRPSRPSFSGRLRDPVTNNSEDTPPGSRNNASPSDSSPSEQVQARQNRTPFRPSRPTQLASTSQLQHSVNVCIEQLKEYNRVNKDTLKAIAASNRRYTEIENSLQATNSKLDQVLAILSTTGQVATSEASARPAPDATYDSPEQIDPQDQIAPDVLQINRRKANGCGHFAGLLLPVVFPELYGPMRTRHLFNLDGSKGKAPLDEEKKKILKTYVNFYYPETRLESSWKTCVAKMNEVLRRKYIPKGRQLQGFENVEDVNDDNHGQSLNLPDGTEDMLGNSLSDIPTPTFEGGFGTYRQYLADADYISTPL